MINYYDEIAALFDVYEKEEHLSEKEIFNRCKLLIKNHNFDVDYMYSVNDVVKNHGYCFQFNVPTQKEKAFSSDEYVSLISNVSKSRNRTEELINYLIAVDDYRLTFASIHALKVKHLIDLGILKSTTWTNEHSTDDFRSLIFNSFDNKDNYEAMMDALEKIGLKYIRLPYMQFWLDMEWLLWTIEQADPRNGHIKVNTIKIAFGIAPRIYFERGDKKYYDVSFSKKLNQYLKLINKDILEDIKAYYGDSADTNWPYGYSLLYKVL